MPLSQSKKNLLSAAVAQHRRCLSIRERLHDEEVKLYKMLNDPIFPHGEFRKQTEKTNRERGIK